MLITLAVIAALPLVVGAEAVHRVLRGSLVRVGHEAYAAAAEASGAPVSVRE
jgi:predicted aconitase with swiveling domain